MNELALSRGLAGPALRRLTPALPIVCLIGALATSLLLIALTGVPLAVPLAIAKLCAFCAGTSGIGAPVASTCAKLVPQTFSVTEKRP